MAEGETNDRRPMTHPFQRFACMPAGVHESHNKVFIVGVLYLTLEFSLFLFTDRNSWQVILSREQPEGQGALVRRSIGGTRLKNFDPFLLLDEFDVATNSGFPDHPHRQASSCGTSKSSFRLYPLFSEEA